MKKLTPAIWVPIGLLVILLGFVWIDFDFLNNYRFFKNLKLVSTFFFGVLPLLLVVLLFILLITNKLAFKIEKLNLGENKKRVLFFSLGGEVK